MKTDAAATVLVVDDDASVRESLSNLLRSTGLNVRTFASAPEFLRSERPPGPSCLVLDVRLPGLSGLDLQRELAAKDAQLPIIFITGHGDIPTSVRAMKAGAIEFLTKPCRDEDLLDAIDQALHRSRHIAADGIQADVSEIVGSSDALRRVLAAVDTVAPTNSTVLIGGETGTGKELVARAIHNLGRRRAKPFVKLNCAAIPSGLLESELFGHEKGAFTGAIALRIGRFELANGGTLFLDEIGDIPLELQPKLLRVLQEQEFERLGSTRTMRVDVRVVAATNVDLVRKVEEKQFRADLYYRLNVFPILIPPLRERRDDVPALVRHFVQKYASRLGKRIDTIAPAAMQAAIDHHWPGNVRELANVVERAVIVCADPILDEKHLGPLAPLAAAPAPPAAASPSAVGLADMEREAIADALERANGNKSRAAALLGVSRMQLYTRLKRHTSPSLAPAPAAAPRAETAPDPFVPLQFGRFTVARHRRELLVAGRPVEIGGRAFDTLIALLDARGSVVERDVLMQHVWPDRVVEDNNLEAQISAVRKALGADRDLIKTVPGRGYQFIGEVRETSVF
jgi:DNA-binding NtrC family response regulator